MNMKKIISAALSLVLAFGAVLPAVQTVSAAPTEEWAKKANEEGKPLVDYLHTPFASAEEKLASMRKVKEEHGVELYFEDYTGEVAIKNKQSGQILFSNPWDIGASYNTGSDETREFLLSQLIISYDDNGVEKKMSSYKEAALRGQIILKNIKGGIRVEYTIGEEKTTRLAPRMIEQSRFEEMIVNNIDSEWVRAKLLALYQLKDPNAPDLDNSARLQMQQQFPATKQMAIYVCSPDITPKELLDIEKWIKQYCPLYSYEELEADHNATGYVVDDAAPPMFKMALEYRITEDGDLEARLPANGIRFDESVFKLKTVILLPYMGAGSNQYTGYTFIPDGSGTLIRYEDVKGETYNVSGQLYGPDYAYHKIGSQHTETMRLPVYGVVTNYKETELVTMKEKLTDAYYDEKLDKTVPATYREYTVENVVSEEDVGFFAIITEGDSLGTLMSEHGGVAHNYNTVYSIFIPRPSDEYNLAESISVGSNATWIVESPRKYTGSYRILYKMLTDEKIAADKNIKDYYAADYMGMVNAYRDYLYETGVLTKLQDTTSDLPLYIETFGSMETTKRIMSFPVEVDTPLTTFEDIKTMYNELTAAGVGRLNFRLTGYSNGGMDATMPYRVDWVKAVGGDEGFADLLKYAAEKGFGIYPDFDFAYANSMEVGDGLSLRKHAIKTIDDRYTSRRHYDAATQSFDRGFSLCISPSVYEYFYDKFNKNYSKSNPTSVSVSTLGTDLNSDFDEDEAYNREDSKNFTVEVLQKISTDYANVMIDGGNAFALPYANHIMKISTNSSQYIQASEAIPFVGMVLHGAKYFAGSPLNMEGDVKSAILKAIENGSSLYFILSMQNTAELKEDRSLSQYYSVSYEIWKEEVVEYYKVLNDATKDLQTSLIVDHAFLDGERVPDNDEKAADYAALQAAKKAEQEAQQKLKDDAERQKKYNELHGITDAEVVAPSAPAETETAPAVSKYATTAGSIVYVEYEGNVKFLLNYNSFEITTKYNGRTYTIPALDFVRIG